MRQGAGIFDVSHMGEVCIRGPQARRPTYSACSPTTCAGSPWAAPSTACCAARTAACSTTCSPTGWPSSSSSPSPTRPTTTRDLAWLQEHASDFDVDVIDSADSFAMLAVQGPAARGLVAALADGPLPPRMHTTERTVAGVPATVCGTGYTGEDGVELLLIPPTPRRCGTRWSRPAPYRSAWAPATRCASRSAFTSTATISRSSAIRSRPVWAGAVKEETGFIGAEACARHAARGTGPAAGAVRHRGRRDRPPGQSRCSAVAR